MKRLTNAWFNIADAAYDHPHIATILTMIGIAGFIVLTIALDFWPVIIALILGITAFFYAMIYSMIKDLL